LTWRERALNAGDALKAAHAEIAAQRSRIGELLGRIRGLEAEWTQDAVERFTAESSTLKQRVRQLTTDNRVLGERLKAARSNLRFQDRRIADLVQVGRLDVCHLTVLDRRFILPLPSLRVSLAHISSVLIHAVS
jgi:uncharacterized protein YukE